MSLFMKLLTHSFLLILPPVYTIVYIEQVHNNLTLEEGWDQTLWRTK